MGSAEETGVTANAGGEPLIIRRNGRRYRVTAIYERWRLADGWWAKEEKRCYFKIRTDRGLVCDVYHDVVADRWYVDRVHD